MLAAAVVAQPQLEETEMPRSRAAMVAQARQTASQVQVSIMQAVAAVVTEPLAQAERMLLAEPEAQVAAATAEA
jgi:hypothetical protein